MKKDAEAFFAMFELEGDVRGWPDEECMLMFQCVFAGMRSTGGVRSTQR